MTLLTLLILMLKAVLKRRYFLKCRATISMNGLSSLLSLKYQLVIQIEKGVEKSHNFHFIDL